jgi:GNAT superfamily N-acetyltransferase
MLLEVVDARLARMFQDLPARLHQGQAAYIGPFVADIEAVFDPAKNPHFKNGEAIRWVLTDGQGQAIGRVAAFLNRDLPTVTDADLPTGGLGFFECINDQAAANQLFDAGRAWLAARGMQAMDGPINFGERDRFWGLLVNGFELEPNYDMFWHPPYYQQLFEGYGFQVYFKQYTCARSVAEPLHPSFAKRAAAFAAEQPAYRFAHARKSEPERMARDFHHVYNLAWSRHSGVKPMSLEQAQLLVKQMKPVVDERLLWFAYHHDEPVAFFISLPELNQILKHVGPRLNWWGKLRFVWERWRYQRRQPKKMFGVIYGVVPEHQGKGVDSAMLVHAQQALLAAGYTHIEMNWIGDFNPRMLATTRSIGAKTCKTHVTYRKLFDETRPFERCPIIK